jgi:hypothetical protein
MSSSISPIQFPAATTDATTTQLLAALQEGGFDEEQNKKRTKYVHLSMDQFSTLLHC